eukprot:3071108-Rhodomonas_salina.1
MPSAVLGWRMLLCRVRYWAGVCCYAGLAVLNYPVAHSRGVGGPERGYGAPELKGHVTELKGHVTELKGH